MAYVDICYYASVVHPMDRQRHYVFDLPVHLCVHACFGVEAFSDWLAVDFCNSTTVTQWGLVALH